MDKKIKKKMAEKICYSNTAEIMRIRTNVFRLQKRLMELMEEDLEGKK